MGLFDFFKGERTPPEKPFLTEYVELHQLAGGSQAVMYTAKHAKTGETRVIKKTFVKDKAQRERFFRELEIGMSLSQEHQYLINCYGYEHKGEEYYMLLEYFPGMSLRHFLRDAIVTRHRNPPFLTGRDYLTLFLHAASALTYIHSKGYLHLDIKPENLMVSGLTLRDEDTAKRVTGDTEVIMMKSLQRAEAIKLKLIDFGVSVKEGEEAPIGGSMFYLAPEIATGARVGRDGVGQWSDVYSLGQTFYELATGSPTHLPEYFRNKDKNWNFYYPEYEKLPKSARSAYEKDMIKERIKKAVDLSALNAAQATKDILAKCLTPDRPRRYQTSNALAQALDGLLTRF